jgi:hypothetical protein
MSTKITNKNIENTKPRGASLSSLAENGGKSRLRNSLPILANRHP